jgi:hypothetical protein
VNPHNQATTYHSTTARRPRTDRRPSNQTCPTDDTAHAVTTAVTGLAPDRPTTTGSWPQPDRHHDRRTARSPPRHRQRGLPRRRAATPAWSPAGGSAAHRSRRVDENGANPGTYSGAFTLGDPGALTGDPDTSAASTARWRDDRPAGGPPRARRVAGSTGAPAWRCCATTPRAAAGSPPDNGGGLSYRAGRTTFNTGRTVASVQGAWHHLAVTKNGAAWLHLDGSLTQRKRRGTTAPVMPWHVMRNGTYAQYAQGHADEVAAYSVALPASTITQHWSAGHGCDSRRPLSRTCSGTPAGGTWGPCGAANRCSRQAGNCVRHARAVRPREGSPPTRRLPR